jgi:WD40 repeat protein
MDKRNCVRPSKFFRNLSCYVTHIEQSFDGSILLSSLSDFKISLVDISTLTKFSEILGHTDSINCMRQLKSNNNVWYSASSDKTICGWDIRSNCNNNSSSIICRNILKDEVNSIAISYNDTLIAVSNGLSILFYDLRKVGDSKFPLIDTYEEIHSDVITQLEFSPSVISFLLSASEDGLICAHDITIADEDDKTISTMNIGCPIRKFGLFGPDYHGLYCISSVEGFSTWHFPSSQRLTEILDIRTIADIDYMVNCNYHGKDNRDDLVILGGKYNGDGKIFQISPDTNNTSHSCLNTLQNGHNDMIRTCVWINNHVNLNTESYKVITGGEDGYLYEWIL